MSAKNINHDRLFKELITTFFIEFLELFFPAVLTYLDQNYIEFLDKEVFPEIPLAESLETDIVVKTKFQGKDAFFLVHVENQAKQKPDFEKRMFRYFCLLSGKHDLPVYPIAVLSFDSPRAAQPSKYRVVFPNKVVMEFNYELIQLNQLNWRNYLQNRNPVAAALMAKMNIARQDRPRVKLECLRLLATLRLDPARMKLISGFVDTYLRLNAEEEVQLKSQISTLQSNEQEEVMEIVTSWMEQGIEQGIERGIERGLILGELKIILRLINRKIGEITPQLLERIRQLSEPKLEDLSEALFDLSSEENLATWLQQNAEEPTEEEGNGS
ncbi:MAG: DUF4351 domain-containing protein [Cyanobacteriota bacterium]|nr:DUF4351 domain-containing protein [Cyanobacteriota bacterium]